MGQAKRTPKFSARLIIISIGFKALHEFAGVSGSSLIPGPLLFILTVTLIPSVSDPETSLILWWH